MKKIYSSIILLALLIAGCSKKLILKNYYFNGKKNQITTKPVKQDFFVNKELGDSLKTKWILDVYGSFSNNSLTVYEKILFVSGLGGRITAFNLKTGKEFGVIKNKGEIRSAPIIKGRKVIFVLNDYKENFGTFHVYDLDYGTEKTVKIDYGSNNKLLTDGKLFYVLSNNGNLFAVNINAKVKWQIKTNEQTLCSPLMIEDYIVWGNQKGKIYVVNKNLKKILYSKNISGGFNSEVTGESKYFYIADINGIAYKIRINNGNVIWKYDTKAPVKNGITFDDKRAFIGNLNGDLFCVNKYSGELYWEKSLGGLIDTTPLIFKDNLIQPNLQKKVDIVSIRSGRIVKTIKVGGRCKTAPIYSNGMIFLGTDYGKIYTFVINGSANE